MYFETVNRDGKTMMCTTFMSCLPDLRQINSMINAGYKFKIDGKIVSKKKLIEFINKKNKQIKE